MCVCVRVCLFVCASASEIAYARCACIRACAVSLFTIKINDMPVERVTEFKFLVDLIDSNLTWSPHCNHIRLIHEFSRVRQPLHYPETNNC